MEGYQSSDSPMSDTRIRAATTIIVRTRLHLAAFAMNLAVAEMRRVSRFELAGPAFGMGSSRLGCAVGG